MISARPIAIVGLRASGKSTLARALAERLGRDFVDLDLEIASLHAIHAQVAEPLRPGDVLAAVGEDYFRDLESRALEKVLARTRPFVLATGGGVVERARNRLLLRTRATSLWLDVPVAELEDRLRADPTPRPPLLGRDAVAEVAEIAERRAPLYRDLAPRVLPAAGLAPEAVLERALALLEETGSPDSGG